MAPSAAYATSGKTYTDGTASACFQYDQASPNGIGRLSAEWTAPGSCSSTVPPSGAIAERQIGYYDPMGRVKTDEQCTTIGNCSSSSYDTLTYGYDLIGDITSSTNGLTGSAALNFSTPYGSTGWLQSASGSISGGNSQTTALFTPSGYTPAGALTNAAIGTTQAISFQRNYNGRLWPTSETDTVANTPGTATIEIYGEEQLTTQSTAAVTFSGSEQSEVQNGTTVYDDGNFIVQVNDEEPYFVPYRNGSTPQSLAAYLAADFGPCTSGATNGGYAVGATVYIWNCQTGTNLTVSAWLSGSEFSTPSFQVTVPATASSSASVTVGGAEQRVSGSWDAGNITASFNGFTETVHYGQFSTPASVASALAGMFSRDYISSGLCAHASGGVVTFQLNGTGTLGPIEISGPTSSFQLSPSVNVPGSGIYDSGTVTLTVGGTQIASTPYGAGSTEVGIASALASASSGNPMVTVSADNEGDLTIMDNSGETLPTYSYSVNFTYDSSAFSSPSFRASPSSGSIAPGGSAPIYNWAITSYASNGNVMGLTDSVMGTWSFSYDDLNRLATSSGNQTGNSFPNECWSYDPFGNRTMQMTANVAFAAGSTGGGLPCQSTGGVGSTYWAQYTVGTNRMSANAQNANQAGGYDFDGDITYDGDHTYGYDAENRQIAMDGDTYVYDAEGRRVAKESGNTLTEVYLLGLDGEQVTELNQSGWAHSNLFAREKLLATYEGPAGPEAQGYYFHLTDALGTERVQTHSDGDVDVTCISYPFGDGPPCAHATENQFTGKERDSESGNDYFGARYYASTTGRFLSPDWSKNPQGVPYADFTNPQTLNLYEYMRNNPLGGVDPDGHCDLCDAVVTDVSVYLAQHPQVANAVDSFANSLGLKVNVGIGRSVSVGGVKLGAAVSLSSEARSDGTGSSSLSGTAAASIDGVGAQASGSATFEKNGSLVNPVNNVSGDAKLTGAISAGDTKGTATAGTNGRIAVGVGVNVGVAQAGVQVTGSSEKLGNVGQAVINGAVHDVQKGIEATQKCTSSGCLGMGSH